MPPAPEWRFRQLQLDQKEVEPTHRQHLAKGGVFRPLIREAIQNSLDAGSNVEPTKVAFTLGVARASACSRYFGSLQPHLHATAACLPDGVPDPANDVPFLAVEDYNTRGLEGEPHPEHKLYRNENNRFRRFWHEVGQSAGVHNRLGSWGVGKVVFANASHIRTFFGVTFRRGDHEPCLMGEAGLAIHSLPGDQGKCDWYGYFASHVPSGRGSLAVPVLDREIVSAFCSLFGVNRSTPGLSIVVPYLRDDGSSVTLDYLAAIVIDEYFLPILAGRLEVTLYESGRAISIDASCLDDTVDKLTWPSGRQLPMREEMLALVRLGRRYLALNDKDYHRVPRVGDETKYCLSDQCLKELSPSFYRGDMVAVHVPVEVKPKGAAAAVETVSVVLEQAESLRKANVRHLRSGIEVSRLRESGGRAVRGFVIVGSDSTSQGALDRLLQRCEEPAHTNWEVEGEGLDRAKELFVDPGRAIRFMRKVAEQIVNQLSTPTEDRDVKTLATFFPDFDGDASSTGSSPGCKKRKVPGHKLIDEPQVAAKGAIEGMVATFVGSSKGLLPVEGALVELSRGGEFVASARTLSEGRFSFLSNAPGDYLVTAIRESSGEAKVRVALGESVGAYLTLVLRPKRPPRMLTRDRLHDGVVVRGNTDYVGPLRTVRLEFAYASWGGARRFEEADFSFNDPEFSIVARGIKEPRADIVVAPNVLEFTPVQRDFCVEVRGFDTNRALVVPVRFASDVTQEEPEDGDD